MKRAIFYGCEDIHIEDRPEPRPGPGEVAGRRAAAVFAAVGGE